ncbi:enoyl-CoA delta isomerase 2 [Tribolium madens]|uniref:enoyl-CoA delta isomerase 2 n=1 Tax=Tribolium madens TaxID=41895 RepID=UPI001CF72AF3|nr:enoyl-CoA delta isomerase 2 [Tribolium madens]XP_044270298.1 enoyl-CoA delta isomerase 2 [Tribolium madens]XP_044270299.1 enoyl-CoA delta isomerase 2 [Tribolium madens]
MSSREMILTLKDGVRVIRINRPKTKNAFDSNVYTTITNTLTEDAQNDNVVVTIITGTGEYYSSGFDIKSAMSKFGSGEEKGVDELKAMINAFIIYPKLLIALINGPAIGIAVTTAALCDIVYASERATFETPFLRIGLCAEGCSSYNFPNILGRSKASEMLFLGKKMKAHEAYQFGFVAEVIPHEKLDEFRNKLLKLGKELSVNGVKITKKLILNNYKNVLCECNERELNQLVECFVSEEFSEGIMKFMSRKSKL